MSPDLGDKCWPSTSHTVYMSFMKIRRGKAELGGCPTMAVHEGTEWLRL